MGQEYQEKRGDLEGKKSRNGFLQQGVEERELSWRKSVVVKTGSKKGRRGEGGGM